VGAKINGRIVPLRYVLRNGDIVDIMTQAGHAPSKDWLAIVKTSRARNKIKHIINESERERAIEIGQKYLEKESRRLGVSMARVQKVDLERVAGEYGLSKVEDLLCQPRLRQVLGAPGAAKVRPRPDCGGSPAPTLPESAPGSRRDDDGVIKIHGVDDVMVYRAKCCNPIKGEAVCHLDERTVARSRWYPSSLQDSER